jgi:curli biogenesis system outer membrane secretion channel CsgG
MKITHYKIRFSGIFLLLTAVLLTACSTTKMPQSTSDGPMLAPSLNLAVWDFDNNTSAGGELDYLGKTLSEQLLVELAKTPDLRLIEREQLKQVLEEEHLSASQLASDETRLKLGRLAGANHMVFGSFMAVGEQIRIDVRVVEVETSLTKFSDGVVTKLGDTTTQLQAIAGHISSELGRTHQSSRL